ncbi:hypothetical protein P280DRAFT_534305 [Massarina eburnea CBS 473.64]|uniref:Uncharacterized protein n=1 Tax=Massarina eburnea CBS 473.64 TaxID=1395130 RepID=A0A6A6RN85_9PLEO|nr:hypothetical protein P280DRAFT_534305 [Massarina eburnea CBS 473.64]
MLFNMGFLRFPSHADLVAELLKLASSVGQFVNGDGGFGDEGASFPILKLEQPQQVVHRHNKRRQHPSPKARMGGDGPGPASQGFPASSETGGDVLDEDDHGDGHDGELGPAKQAKEEKKIIVIVVVVVVVVVAVVAVGFPFV